MKKVLLLLIALTFITHQSNSQELWGMSFGGSQDLGTIFKVNSDGSNHTIVHVFTNDFDGHEPQYFKLCEGDNNKLYGMTAKGGLADGGILFEYDPTTDTYTKKIDFAYDSVDAKAPYGGLMLASNNKMYGVSRNGGANNNGVLFEYDYHNNTYTKLNDFNLSTTGSNPTGNLLEASDGKLYGMSSLGGPAGDGAIYRYDIDANSFNIVIYFGTTNGANPYGELVETSDNKLYGMTSRGGTNDMGVLFEYDLSTTTYTKKIDFDGTTKGKYPYGGISIGDDGKLYGVTRQGGTNNQGILFKFDQSINSFTELQDFSTAFGTNPYGTMLLKSDGKFIGLTSNTVYEYDPTLNVLEKKQDLAGTARGSIMMASNGKYYTGTLNGGHNNQGVVQEYDSNSNTLSTVYSFNSVYKGKYPTDGLVLASDDKLYAVTWEGEQSATSKLKGTLIRIDPLTEEVNIIYDFNLASNGLFPYRAPIQASNGFLYGQASEGGVNDNGVIYKFDINTDTYTKLFDFDPNDGISANNGWRPNGRLIEASNGKLYGVAANGGAYNDGVIYEYDMDTDTYTRKVNFSQSFGKAPQGLMEASNGKIYGCTSIGGAYGSGVMFEYIPGEATYTVLVDFGGTESAKLSSNAGVPSNGKNPFGNLTEASNGKLYGMTYQGGTNNFGIIYEYDFNTNTYTKKIDFDGTNNGSNPGGDL
ncbi:choice-of-anchor tandem repeat GloVer-containing protein [Tamlana flava]|uniref:choice-of-anchor tandem repeat GloVer-containing protein n=1 Tax=Tamlana flava TaxID=3158572 RepID=UPI00351BA92E